MSFMNEMERNRIYEEMEGSHSSKPGIFSKVLSIALLLALGFASGSIYSAFSNGNINAKNEVASSNDLNNNSILVSNNNNNNNASNQMSMLPLSVSSLVNQTADSVVEILQYTTTTSMFSSSTYTTPGSGSGVVISKDGYILTNNHVVSGASKITVKLRTGEEYEATLVGTDTKTDIAIIKIDADNLVPASIGDSSKTLVGDFVIAIGNPLGQLGGTVTYGYVSALEREINIDSSTKNLMQFDAAVNPGNSGGGLFNVNGELIGIVSAKSTGYDVEGLSFAIPVNDVKQVITDILDHGYATNRPFLGVSLSNSTYSTGNQFGGLFGMFYQQLQYGALVDSVVEDSPAEKAGIEKDDIIISVNGNVVTQASEVTAAISECNVGDKVEIGIIRENRTKTVTATLEEYKGQ